MANFPRPKEGIAVLDRACRHLARDHAYVLDCLVQRGSMGACQVSR